MKKYKTVPIEIEQVVDVICDSCQKSCRTLLRFEYITIHHQWGHGTPSDTDIWDAHICYDCCMTKLKPIINFKISEGSVWGEER